MASVGNVAQLSVTVTANTQQAETGLMSLTSILGKTGPLALAAVGIGVIIGGIGIAALHMAGDFQSGMETIVTGADESQSALGMISAGVLKIAQATGTSTSNLVNGLFMIESAGYRGSDGLKVLTVAAEGAKVGNADLGTVANALTTIMKDFGLKSSQAAYAMNILTATVANGKTHMQDLAGAMSTILPAAAAMHLHLTDVMAALATMTNQGTDAASAATYLRMTLLMLEAPSKQATKALNAVGLTTDQVAAEMKKSLPDALNMILQHVNKTYTQGSAEWTAAMKDIVGGTRSMQGILELTSKTGMADFLSLSTKISKQAKEGGDSVNGWAATQRTFNLQMSRAGEAVQVLFIELGQKLLPVATQLAQGLANNLIPTIQNFISMITGSSQEAQILRPILIAIAAAIAGALVLAFIAWAGAAAAAAAATIAATWPILAAGAAIGLLVAGLIWAYNNWGWFRTAVNLAIKPLKDIGGYITQTVIPTLGELASWLGPKLGAVFGALGNGIDKVIDFFKMLISIAQKVIDIFKGVASAIGNALGAAGNAASGLGGLLSHIPHFAEGGIVNQPTVALVGEAGPEVVVPVSQLASGSNAIQGIPSGGSILSGGGGSSSQQLQSTFIIQLDGKTITNQVVKHMPGIVRLGTGTRNR